MVFHPGYGFTNQSNTHSNFGTDKCAPGFPPLYQAIVYQQKQSIKLLLTHGANPNDYVPPEARDMFDKKIRFYRRLVGLLDTGGTPLIVAARVVKDVEITRMLLEGGADPNFLTPSNSK